MIKHIFPVDRSRDDQVLQWVKWRAEGISARTIAKHTGYRPGAIITATNNVKDADIAESGELDARAAYLGQS